MPDFGVTETAEAIGGTVADVAGAVGEATAKVVESVGTGVAGIAGATGDLVEDIGDSLLSRPLFAAALGLVAAGLIAYLIWSAIAE